MNTYRKYYYIGLVDGHVVESGFNITRVRQKLMGYTTAEKLYIHVYKHDGVGYVPHVVRPVRGGFAI